MKRPRDLVLPRVELDRHCGVALHRQIRKQITEAIRGAKPGSRLPSTRSLAKLLGVSRNTVLSAYDELVADGLLEARQGSAMFVRGSAQTGVVALDLRRLLRDVQYPLRTLTVEDPDGTPLSFNY